MPRSPAAQWEWTRKASSLGRVPFVPRLVCIYATPCITCDGAEACDQRARCGISSPSALGIDVTLIGGQDRVECCSDMVRSRGGAARHACGQRRVTLLRPPGALGRPRDTVEIGTARTCHRRGGSSQPECRRTAQGTGGTARPETWRMTARCRSQAGFREWGSGRVEAGECRPLGHRGSSCTC